ncbi:hypothetical protein BP5796_12285 [Coleophoma crateriformis]|uniref:Uncharacterized protein n=1 Tax=Coleophoma crateriformis TaxID=565419 RepID=A0A3D8Q941_9HELO|nr:hypothetical protein BP5796_12285 [Coleophoma crateriformis]
MRNGLSREEIEMNLSQKFPGHGSKDVLSNSIDLVVRLILMLDVGELRNAYSGRNRLIWKDGLLQDYVRHVFSDNVSLIHDGIKLGTMFTARSLDQVAGFGVNLTTNLADHLRLRHEDRAVTIFHHASFLQCQLQQSILSPELVEETLNTLALLFPVGDSGTKKWYHKQNEPEELDPGVLNCGRHRGDDYRQIGKYRFWHDRLVILKEAFDESQPNNVSQLWNDRREGSQWYGLWVAIGITLFFGLVQSIEGAMQVYKAYQPS